MDQAEYRRLQRLIEPKLTPEDLDEFIQEFLNIELPWHTVDELSTSAPLKFIWEVNQTMVTGKGSHRHVLAAARNSTKTLGSAILQFIALLHFRRDANHLSSTLEQSAALIRYMDQFMRIPQLQPFQNTDNVRRKEFINLPPNDYTNKNSSSLQVITASKKGANSSRCSFITFDEVDLTPPEILSEAAFILDPTRDGHKFDPIAVYLSSRKTNNGPIQDLIDESEDPENKKSDNPIVLHKWSAVDFQEKCTDEVSKRDEGSSKAWIHTETLSTLWTEEEYEDIPESRKSEYIERVAYPGCKACPAWVACQGRAVNQKGTSPMLRQRSFTGIILKAVKDPSNIIAQALNWKPESSGLVFRMFSKFHHLKDHQDFYEWVTFGERFDPFGYGEAELNRRINSGTAREIAEITPTKEQIYDAMVEHGWHMVSGVDFGHSPDPAVCVILGYHEKADLCAVLTSDNANGFANHRWAEYCSKSEDGSAILEKFPVSWVGPDLADKSAPSYFGKHQIKSLNKKPSRIEPGVSFLRGMLWDAVSNSPRFAILDDSQDGDKNGFIVEELEKYAHARDVNGKIQKDKFVDAFNHSIDAMRYGLAPFADKKNIKASAIQFAKTETTRDLVAGAAQGNKESIEIIKEKEKLQNQMKEHMLREHGLSNIFGTNVQADPASKNSKKSAPTSGIKFSIGGD